MLFRCRLGSLVDDALRFVCAALNGTVRQDDDPGRFHSDAHSECVGHPIGNLVVVLLSGVFDRALEFAREILLVNAYLILSGDFGQSINIRI